MTQSSATQPSKKAVDREAIREFQVGSVPEVELTELRRREQPQLFSEEIRAGFRSLR